MGAYWSAWGRILLCAPTPVAPSLSLRRQQVSLACGREDDSAVIKIFPGIDLPKAR